MKLHEMWVTICALVLIASGGCERVEYLEPEPTCPGCVAEGSEERPLSLEATRAIQNRADAAFDAIDAAKDDKTRFETRIGPQPWPRDLPEDWPRPKGARVLADTNGRDNGRLLLVDLSDSVDQAFDSYQGALRENGYEVVRTGTAGRGKALRASRGKTEATLHFFARADSTRLEMLFVTQSF